MSCFFHEKGIKSRAIYRFQRQLESQFLGMEADPSKWVLVKVEYYRKKESHNGCPEEVNGQVAHQGKCYLFQFAFST